MRPLAIWLVVVVAVFAGLAVAASLWPEDEAKQVFVVVDSSFAMREVWDQVDDELDRIDDRDNATFALATEKDFIHGFQDQLRLGAISAFAPCDFAEIETYTQMAEADDLILITTGGSCDTTALVDWEIRELGS